MNEINVKRESETEPTKEVLNNCSSITTGYNTVVSATDQQHPLFRLQRYMALYGVQPVYLSLQELANHL
jgi:hypothetical protein